MIEKFVYFNNDYKPDENFIEFCNDLGYKNIFDIISETNCNIANPIIENFIFDEKIVKYVEDHSTKNDNFTRMKGAITSKRLIGFYGFAYILQVDTSTSWEIIKSTGIPEIKYAHKPSNIIHVITKKTNKGFLYTTISNKI